MYTPSISNNRKKKKEKKKPQTHLLHATLASKPWLPVYHY